MGCNLSYMRRRMHIGAQPHKAKASGAVATFRTNLAARLDSLFVDVTPVQDLHGQANPYPAGGGKNKFPITLTTQTKNGTTFTVSSDGVITVSGTPSEQTRVSLNSLSITPDANYKFSMTGSATGIRVFCVKTDGSSTTYPTLTPNATLPTGYTYSSFLLEVGTTFPGTATTLKMQLEVGETVTDWVPYENICPITGWTGCNVWDDPAYGGMIKWNQNLNSQNAVESYTKFNVELHSVQNKFAFIASGTYSYSSGDRNYYIMNLYNRNTLIEGHKYCVTNTSKYFCAYVYGGSVGGKTATVTGNVINKNNQKGAIITCTASGGYRVSLHAGSNIENGTEINETIFINIFDLTEMFGAGNEPTTVDAFRALFPNDYYEYNEGIITTVSAVNGDPYRHYNISWQDEAGTVYGGTLTVNDDGTGTLVVDRIGKVFRESDVYTTASNTVIVQFGNDKVLSSVTQSASGQAKIINSHYKLDRNHGGWGAIDENCFIVAGGYYWGTPFTGTSAEYKAFLEAQYAAGTPVSCVALLETEATYNLTDLEVIEMLKGINNVWADCGDVSLTYWTNI